MPDGKRKTEKANRSDYKPFQVDEINTGRQFVRFANSVELSLGEELGADKEAIFDAQIRYTVEEHFQKRARLRAHGIKVISLFFIDRVANYADEDGIIRRLFDRAFEELKAGHPEWEKLSAEEVQAAYFAEQRPRCAGHGKAHLRKRRVLSDEFKALWERIKHKTRYAVEIDTDKLLDEAVPDVEREAISPPRVTITKVQMAVDEGGAFQALQASAAKKVKDLAGRYPLPNLVDVMSNLLENTTPPVRLTRRTLLEVFRRAGNKQVALDNPHEWASVAVRVLKDKLMDQLVDGIRYEKLSEWYEMQQILDAEVVEVFSRYAAKPDVDKDKTVYDLIPCDSDIEREFVKGLEARKDVKLYVKLPRWFSVPTPVGDYNPDWAIVMDGWEEDGKHVLYLVSETKGEDWRTELRPSERRKIECGAAHFGSVQLGKDGALDEVDYKVISDASELP